MMSSKNALAAVALALPVILTGCGKADHQPEGATNNKVANISYTGVYAVKLQDTKSDRKVNCVYVDSVEAGGLSCDWSAVAGTSPALSFISKEKVASANQAGIRVVTVEGRKFDREQDVSCVYVDSVKAGGLSCNW